MELLWERVRPTSDAAVRNGAGLGPLYNSDGIVWKEGGSARHDWARSRLKMNQPFNVKFEAERLLPTVSRRHHCPNPGPSSRNCDERGSPCDQPNDDPRQNQADIRNAIVVLLVPARITDLN